MTGGTCTLHLTGMAHGGEALGRDETGRVVFVPYAIAGEEARVEVVEERKEFARARLVEVIRPSPSRVTPRCPHFGPPSPTTSRPAPSEREGLAFAKGCGGCQWQHIDYDSQLDFKTRIVREQFARIAKMPDAPVALMLGGRAWNYRNHMRFVVDQQSRPCLQALESHDLVHIRECHIMNAQLVSLFRALELEGGGYEAVTLRAGEATGDRLLVLESNEPEPPELETDEAVSIHFRTDDRDLTLIGKEAIEEQVGGRTFRISPGAFFQVNTPMAEVLLGLVDDWLAPRAGDMLLDAYCGVGLFGLSLASRVGRVFEIEESAEALEDARYNGRDLENVEFYQGRVEDVLPQRPWQIQIAIVDPPRAGLAAQALESLAAQAPRALAYVSCDPATLARDARRLVERGYRVTRVQPVDLFPQTFHIECVTLFESLA